MLAVLSADSERPHIYGDPPQNWDPLDIPLARQLQFFSIKTGAPIAPARPLSPTTPLASRYLVHWTKDSTSLLNTDPEYSHIWVASAPALVPTLPPD